MLKNCNLKNVKAETYILKKKNGSNFSENESLNFINPINEILSFLYEKNIQSVLIEGGAKTISSRSTAPAGGVRCGKTGLASSAP